MAAGFAVTAVQHRQCGQESGTPPWAFLPLRWVALTVLLGESAPATPSWTLSWRECSCNGSGPPRVFLSASLRDHAPVSAYIGPCSVHDLTVTLSPPAFCCLQKDKVAGGSSGVRVSCQLMLSGACFSECSLQCELCCPDILVGACYAGML